MSSRDVPEHRSAAMAAEANELGGASAHARGSEWALEVISALSRLESPQSEALRLIYFQRQSQKQVAAQLSLPPETVAAHVAGGMRALAAALC